MAYLTGISLPPCSSPPPGGGSPSRQTCRVLADHRGERRVGVASTGWQNPPVTDHETGAVQHGKRVSWVELYFDLIFVFAVSQVAHAIVVDPHWSRVLAALGLFGALWWTWIGFAVLYNRTGDDRRPSHRLFVLIGTVPCAIAATQAHHVFEGHPGGFALALAGARLVLAVAHALSVRGEREVRRIGLGYAVAVALFALSALLPEPWCYLLWAATLLQEGSFLLLGERQDRVRADRARRAADGTRGARPQRLDRAARIRRQLAPPRNPQQAVDAA